MLEVVRAQPDVDSFGGEAAVGQRKRRNAAAPSKARLPQLTVKQRGYGAAGLKWAKVVERCSAIASGAREQSVGLAEVKIGVTQLDQVTQHNAAMVEESTTASLALKQEAAGMATLVAQFSLRPGSGRDDSGRQADAAPSQRRYAHG